MRVGGQTQPMVDATLSRTAQYQNINAFHDDILCAWCVETVLSRHGMCRVRGREIICDSLRGECDERS